MERRLPVEFNERWIREVAQEVDTYIQKGMRGRLVELNGYPNGLLGVSISLEGFEAYNREFETNDFVLIRNGKRINTNAREAGWYKDVEEIIWKEDEDFMELLILISEHQASLRAAFQPSEDTPTYRWWLEKQLEEDSGDTSET